MNVYAHLIVYWINIALSKRHDDKDMLMCKLCFEERVDVLVLKQKKAKRVIPTTLELPPPNSY